MDCVEQQIRAAELEIVLDGEGLFDHVTAAANAVLELTLSETCLCVAHAQFDPQVCAHSLVLDSLCRLQTVAVPADRLGVLAHVLAE